METNPERAKAANMAKTPIVFPRDSIRLLFLRSSCEERVTARPPAAGPGNHSTVGASYRRPTLPDDFSEPFLDYSCSVRRDTFRLASPPSALIDARPRRRQECQCMKLAGMPEGRMTREERDGAEGARPQNSAARSGESRRRRIGPLGCNPAQPAYSRSRRVSCRAARKR